MINYWLTERHFRRDVTDFNHFRQFTWLMENNRAFWSFQQHAHWGGHVISRYIYLGLMPGTLQDHVLLAYKRGRSCPGPDRVGEFPSFELFPAGLAYVVTRSSSYVITRRCFRCIMDFLVALVPTNVDRSFGWWKRKYILLVQLIKDLLLIEKISSSECFPNLYILFSYSH
jgi:hypothetical protein